MKNNATRQIRSLLLCCCFFALGLGFLLAGVEMAGGPSPVAATSSSTMEVRHPVGPGEDLHLLAAYYYGDARQWEKIFQANRHQIKNPNRISPQQVLRIEVPTGWQPRMPFSAWMEQFRAAPSSKEAPPTEAEKLPSGEPGKKESKGGL
ncbi:MAG TPA: hypothetical protein VGB21_01610 [Candidatus Methylomirabilis sp.]